jgi:hypothetical protein
VSAGGRSLLTAIVASSGEQLVSCRSACRRRRAGGRSARRRSGRPDDRRRRGIADGGGSTPRSTEPGRADDRRRPDADGLSADGKTLVLSRPATRIAPDDIALRDRAVPADRGAPELAPRVVELPGALDFDAISPDGRILYVVQHLDGEGGYQVRAVDLPAGTMRPDIITDKRNLGEAMAGYPLAQLRSPTGMVLTLYRGTDHPFIHALEHGRGVGRLHRPARWRTATDDADWGLAASTGWARSTR